MGFKKFKGSKPWFQLKNLLSNPARLGRNSDIQGHIYGNRDCVGHWTSVYSLNLCQAKSASHLLRSAHVLEVEIRPANTPLFSMNLRLVSNSTGTWLFRNSVSNSSHVAALPFLRSQDVPVPCNCSTPFLISLACISMVRYNVIHALYNISLSITSSPF